MNVPIMMSWFFSFFFSLIVVQGGGVVLKLECAPWGARPSRNSPACGAESDLDAVFPSEGIDRCIDMCKTSVDISPVPVYVRLGALRRVATPHGRDAVADARLFLA